MVAYGKCKCGQTPVGGPSETEKQRVKEVLLLSAQKLSLKLITSGCSLSWLPCRQG